MRESDGEESGESLGLLAFPARLPVLTLAVAIGVTAFLGMHAMRIRADASPATLLPSRTSARLAEVGVELDDAQSIAVGVFADDVLAPAELRRIAELSARLAHLKGIAAVLGPTTLPRAEPKGEGFELKPLAEVPPKSEAGARELRAAILAHPLSGAVVARDGRAAVLWLRLETRALEADRYAALEAKVREAAAELGGPDRVAIAGSPVLGTAAARELERELPVLAGGALAVVAVAALLCLRSIGGALLTCLTVAIAVVWSLGLFELTGQRIGFASVLLPALLVLLGGAGPLILLVRLSWERRTGRTRTSALIATVGHTRLPLAVWALATAIGALALTTSSVPALGTFGWQGAIGAFSLLAATVLVALPAAALWPAGFGARVKAVDGVAERRLETTGSWIDRHRLAVVLLASPLVAAAAWGAARVVGDGSYAAYSAEDSAARRDEKRITDQVVPLTTVTIAMRGYEPHAMGRRDALVALGDLQQYLAKQPGVKATRSLLDYMAVVQRAREPDAAFELPESQSKIDALLKVDPQALREVANPDLSRARIVVHTTLATPADVERFVASVFEFASPKLSRHGFGSRALFPRGVEVRPQGTFLALELGARILPERLLRAVGYAALALLVLASLIFLSPRVGAAAVSLNTVAPLVLFGVAGAFGVPLTVTSACLAPLLLGVAVGHTLHYLTSCATAGDRRGDPVGSDPADVMSVVGRPIAYAGAAFALGCLTFLHSPLAPLRGAGILGASAAAATFAANALLLATRLLTTRILTLSDLLLARVGRPEDIALFAGLRPFQTKIVMLTGRLASAAPGDFITRRGEVKQELYVLLSGHADVRAGEQGPTIGTLARGEVIGEMSLVRDQPRSADVVATEVTEYLVLDGHFLDRLRRQYPRIAAVVFLNLSRILSDRLERTTARLAEGGAPRGEH